MCNAQCGTHCWIGEGLREASHAARNTARGGCRRTGSTSSDTTRACSVEQRGRKGSGAEQQNGAGVCGTVPLQVRARSRGRRLEVRERATAKRFTSRASDTSPRALNRAVGWAFVGCGAQCGTWLDTCTTRAVKPNGGSLRGPRTAK